MTRRWYRVAHRDEIPTERPLAVEAAGVRLAVLRLGDRFHAVEDRCPHMAHPLHRGFVRDGRLICSWHEWEFDLEGEQRYLNPEARCVSYPLREEDGDLLVEIDPENLPEPPGGFPREGV